MLVYITTKLILVYLQAPTSHFCNPKWLDGSVVIKNRSYFGSSYRLVRSHLNTLSLSLSFPSFSLFVSLSCSFYFSHFLSLFISLSLSLYFCLYLSLYLFHSLFLYFSHSFCLFLSLSFSLTSF